MFKKIILIAIGLLIPLILMAAERYELNKDIITLDLPWKLQGVWLATNENNEMILSFENAYKAKIESNFIEFVSLPPGGKYTKNYDNMMSYDQMDKLGKNILKKYEQFINGVEVGSNKYFVSVSYSEDKEVYYAIIEKNKLIKLNSDVSGGTLIPTAYGDEYGMYYDDTTKTVYFCSIKLVNRKRGTWGVYNFDPATKKITPVYETTNGPALSVYKLPGVDYILFNIYNHYLNKTNDTSTLMLVNVAKIGKKGQTSEK